jgi:hypothetical protein
MPVVLIFKVMRPMVYLNLLQPLALWVVEDVGEVVYPLIENAGGGVDYDSSTGQHPGQSDHHPQADVNGYQYQNKIERKSSFFELFYCRGVGM